LNKWRIHKGNYILTIVSIEAIVMVWLCLPFTAVGMRSLNEYQELLSEAPGGIIKNYQVPEKEITKNYPSTEKLIGGWGFYSKVAALPDNLYYPLFLKENQRHFSNGTYKRYHPLPFSFLSTDSIMPSLTPVGFSAFQISVSTISTDTLVIKQNYFPGWATAAEHGKNYSVVPVQGGWVGIPLVAGHHSFNIRFQRSIFHYLLWYQLAIGFLTGIYLGIHYLIRYILPYPARK
jgi:hypothetical protein